MDHTDKADTMFDPDMATFKSFKTKVPPSSSSHHELQTTPEYVQYIDETHTELMESQTELEDISNQVSFVLRNDKLHVILEWIVIILLAIDMAIFSASQTGLVYFITTYCDEYLKIDESNGRFMISVYYGGQLMYRLIFALFIGDKYKNIRWFNPKKTILLGFVIMMVFSIIFIISPQDVVVLYIVYTMCGMFGGGIFPDIYKWCEAMRPVSGILSCFYIIGFAIGDALTVFIIGELFERIGAYMYPYPIMFINLIGLLLTISIVIVFVKYSRHKSSILWSYYTGK